MSISRHILTKGPASHHVSFLVKSRCFNFSLQFKFELNSPLIVSILLNYFIGSFMVVALPVAMIAPKKLQQFWFLQLTIELECQQAKVFLQFLNEESTENSSQEVESTISKWLLRNHDLLWFCIYKYRGLHIVYAIWY